MEWKHCLFFVTKRCYVLFSIKKRHWSNPLTANKCTSMYIYVLSNVAITRIIYSTAINHSTNHASPSSISFLKASCVRSKGMLTSHQNRLFLKQASVGMNAVEFGWDQNQSSYFWNLTTITIHAKPYPISSLLCFIERCIYSRDQKYWHLCTF